MDNNNNENLKKGYIKLHRSLIDWEWYDDINVCRLFIHFLLRANHADRAWRGQIVRRGSFITSREKLSAETNLTVQQIRTAIFKLKSTNEITSKTTNRNTTITINNYNFYQELTNEITSNSPEPQPTDNQQITTNNELNKLKNTNSSSVQKNKQPQQQRKVFKKPSIEEIQKYISEKNLSVDGEKFLAYYEANGWKVGRNPMKSWKSSLIYWNKNEKKDDNADFLERVERAFSN